MGLHTQILKAVQEAGYTEPTPIQAAAIPQILAGHDLIGIAQTGTGKTAAFVLPILTKLAGMADVSSRRHPRALVVAPTRELAAQIEENVRIYGKHLPLRAAVVFGGVNERPQIEALRAGVDLLVATPGRLLDLMGRRLADLSGLNFLVLDEAERMLDMGFLPDIRRIVKALPTKRQTLLFTATLSQEIEKITHEFLRAPKTIQIGRRANPAETVTQLVYEVPRHLKSALLVHLLRDPSFDMVLVFSRMKHGADRLARQLESAGVKTATLHSNRSQNQRLRALKDFKSGAVRVLVATDIAARGIDVDDISHVVNYDFPMHPEDYVHRIGRTGRAHAVGDALSFVTPEDHSELRAVERFIGRGLVRKRAEGFNYAAASIPSVGDGGRHGGSKRGGVHPMPSGRPAPKGHSDRREGFGSGRARQEHGWRRRG
ncbi:MAG: DEAD/DEAH box helicase [Verrucomicrobia bacterium]|nr:DEAD/DEAH box helicase [Verrucomicrobiota bacterium]